MNKRVLAQKTQHHKVFDISVEKEIFFRRKYP